MKLEDIAEPGRYCWGDGSDPMAYWQVIRQDGVLWFWCEGWPKGAWVSQQQVRYTLREGTGDAWKDVDHDAWFRVDGEPG